MRQIDEFRLSEYHDYGRLAKKDHIHLVRHKVTGKICVKKKLESMQKEIQEFRLSNPCEYFPKVYEIVEDDESIILIEEYIEGMNLEEYRMGEALEEENAVKIAIQIAQGLKCLHEHQPMIIYRDLKPENIMITLEGKVKLIDFDISRKYQTGKLRDTELLGTVGYAAPEQFGYFQTDNRTDIFAFGLVFNCMLTGDFSAHNLAKGKYEKLIQKCIALNPADRYKRMDEILKELLPEQQNTVTEIYFEKKEYSGQEVYFGWKANSGQEVNSGRKAYFGQRVYFEQENSSHDERGIRSWILPGFRTRTRWKMIVAGVSYLMIFLIGWMLDATSEVPDAYKTIDLWLNRILLVISQFITIMLVFNYRGISKKIPFYRSKYRIIKIVSFLVTWFVITFATLIFTAILEGILFL